MTIRFFAIFILLSFSGCCNYAESNRRSADSAWNGAIRTVRKRGNELLSRGRYREASALMDVASILENGGLSGDHSQRDRRGGLRR